MTLLKTTFLVQELPAWSSNLGKRVVKSPKLCMVDTGLACSLINIDEEGLRQGGEIAGRVFENFVILELFKHASWSDETVRLYHFRSQSGKEVDVVLEEGKGELSGSDQAFSNPFARDFSGLKVLRDQLGEKFIRGVLRANTGKDIVPFGENLHALPVRYLCQAPS